MGALGAIWPSDRPDTDGSHWVVAAKRLLVRLRYVIAVFQERYDGPNRWEAVELLGEAVRAEVGVLYAVGQ